MARHDHATAKLCLAISYAALPFSDLVLITVQIMRWDISPGSRIKLPSMAPSRRKSEACPDRKYIHQHQLPVGLNIRPGVNLACCIRLPQHDIGMVGDDESAIALEAGFRAAFDSRAALPCQFIGSCVDRQSIFPD